MDSSFSVFFPSGQADLAVAATAIEEAGLDITRQAEHLEVAPESDFTETLKFEVRFEEGPQVDAVIDSLQGQVEGADVLVGLSARFLISFTDLEAALDEANTVIDLQLALQEATDGALYLTWNNVVQEP